MPVTGRREEQGDGLGGPFKRRGLASGTAGRLCGHFREAGNATPEVSGERERRRRGLTAMGRNKKKRRDGDGRRPRLILSFDEEKRR